MTNLPDWITRTREEPLSGTRTRVTDTRTRLGLDVDAMASYLGVPVFTYKKWEAGTRVPGAAVTRLLDVLAAVEREAPGLHTRLVAGSNL